MAVFGFAKDRHVLTFTNWRPTLASHYYKILVNGKLTVFVWHVHFHGLAEYIRSMLGVYINIDENVCHQTSKWYIFDSDRESVYGNTLHQREFPQLWRTKIITP